MGKTKERKLNVIVALGFIMIISMFSFTLLGCAESEEVKSAKESLNAEISRIDGQISTLNEDIAKADELLAGGESPLDEDTIPALEEEVANAKSISFEKPSIPSKVEDIQSKTNELKSIDYSSDIRTLEKATSALSTSIEQKKLVMNPTEEYVLSCLKKVKGIDGIAAITEKTDTNGLLNKPGSYVVRVVFSSPDVDQSLVLGNTLAEKGTDAGGSIEVFTTEEDAQEREIYLAAYDGTILSSGSHAVYGTVLIRTSDELTATQQKKLENQILKALTDTGK